MNFKHKVGKTVCLKKCVYSFDQKSNLQFKYSNKCLKVYKNVRLEMFGRKMELQFEVA